MLPELAQIEFYFPEKSHNLHNKQGLVDAILSMMRERGSIEYSGYTDEESLSEGILQRIGNAEISQYKVLLESQQQDIIHLINEAIVNSQKLLTVPTKNYVFVFPYLPTGADDVFGGVMGSACYSCVFHIFVSSEDWSQEALIDTVVHELNHTIYYYHHYDNFGNYSLLDDMLIEGLAENFREQVLGTAPAPWSIALTQMDGFREFGEISEDILNSKDPVLKKQVLFGNDKYSRWTGYSIGYWLIKKCFIDNPDLSWEQIMKLPSKKVLEITKIK